MTGTRVRYWADQQIFPKDAAFDYDELVARARQTSFLVPGLTLVIRDERGRAGHARGGRPARGDLRPRRRHLEFVEFLAPDAAVTDIWRLQGIGHLHRDGAGARRQAGT